MTDLQAIQIALEEEALAIGIRNYDKRRQKDEAQTRPGKRLVREAIEPLGHAIEAWVADVTSGKPTQFANLGYFLQDVDPLAAAWLTARKVIGSMTKRASLQNVALSLAGIIEDAVNFDKLATEAPKAYKKLQQKISKSSDQGYRHVVMRRQQKYAGVRTIKWSVKDKLTLGMLLIDLMENSVLLDGKPVFKKELHGFSKTRRLYVLTPCEGTVEWLEKSHEFCRLMEPMYMPMVVPPMGWTTIDDGGYLSKRLRYSLLKAHNRRNYLEELRHVEMPMVYQAVNALQNTKWRVNAGIVKLMREVWDGGMNIGKLPTKDKLPVPPDAGPEATDEEITRVKAQKFAVHEANIRGESKRLAMGLKIWLAEKFAEFPAIYFPHALDWRGRAYPVASYLHPQADDPAKALLEFSEGVPLGENGAFWLAVHGANCYGVDKVSFEDRAQWVMDHEQEILESAVNPLEGSRFWAQTDESPWRFLAFCKEWAGFVMSGRSSEYVSHQPVAFDGSCNGLQHYSMMLRDEKGGAATNLVPAKTPSDIYTLVAQQAERIAAQDENNPDAQAWKGKVTRKIAKRPTMTMPYGAGQFGYKEQILDDLRKIKEDTGSPHLGKTDEFMAALYLSRIMPEALGGVVVKAAEAMEWLQTTARIAAEDYLPIRWDSPSGLPVVQDYREMEGKRIEMELLGQRYRLMLQQEGDKLDRRKQAQGIAPNFVHTLDAAHMMRTTVLCVEQGITSFAMIHDSYGAHAGHADTLNYLLREAFVQQYTPDVLGQFREALLAQLPPKLAAKIPPLPSYGTLDHEAVRDSDYFFA